MLTVKVGGTNFHTGKLLNKWRSKIGMFLTNNKGNSTKKWGSSSFSLQLQNVRLVSKSESMPFFISNGRTARRSSAKSLR